MLIMMNRLREMLSITTIPVEKRLKLCNEQIETRKEEIEKLENVKKILLKR
jgi:hypothetical protein